MVQAAQAGAGAGGKASRDLGVARGILHGAHAETFGGGVKCDKTDARSVKRNRRSLADRFWPFRSTAAGVSFYFLSRARSFDSAASATAAAEFSTFLR
jgi:hypothetical protein